MFRSVVSAAGVLFLTLTAPAFSSQDSVLIDKTRNLTKYLHVSTGEGDKPNEMKMTLYDSRKDMEDGENSQGEATWYRDE